MSVVGSRNGGGGDRSEDRRTGRRDGRRADRERSFAPLHNRVRNFDSVGSDRGLVEDYDCLCCQRGGLDVDESSATVEARSAPPFSHKTRAVPSHRVHRGKDAEVRHAKGPEQSGEDEWREVDGDVEDVEVSCRGCDLCWDALIVIGSRCW